VKALIGRIYRKHLPGYLFILPALAVMSLLILYPLYQTFFLSFYREVRFRELSFMGLGNFVEVITSDYFVKILLNTLVWTGGTVIFQFLVGLGVAVLFNAGLRGTPGAVRSSRSGWSLGIGSFPPCNLTFIGSSVQDNHTPHHYLDL